MLHPTAPWAQGGPRRAGAGGPLPGGAGPPVRHGEAARPRRRLRTHRKSWSRPLLRSVRSTKPSMTAAAEGQQPREVRGGRGCSAPLRPGPAPPGEPSAPVRVPGRAAPRRCHGDHQQAGQVSPLKPPPGCGAPVTSGCGGSSRGVRSGPARPGPSAPGPRSGRCGGDGGGGGPAVSPALA